jgi:ABC-2 type transport system permease protein
LDFEFGYVKGGCRLSLFLAYIRLNIKMMFQYRKGFLISALIHPLELVVGAVIFTSIYSYGNLETLHGYSLPQIIWYIGGMQIVGTIIWNNASSRIPYQIRDGSLTVQMLKPVTLFGFELANAIALRTVGILFEFVPILAIQMLIFFPDFITSASTLKFIVCVAFSFLLFFLLNFLVAMTAFYMKNNSSMVALKSILTAFAGGTIIPIEFFPSWLQKWSETLPFRYLYYEPLQFFLNREPARSWDYFVQVIGMQVFWIASFYLAIKLLWPIVIKRYCAVGG